MKQGGVELNPDEMIQFGYDPSNESDREAFADIVRTGGDVDAPVEDYSKDPFEFGGQPLPRQLGETIVESEVQINSGD